MYSTPYYREHYPASSFVKYPVRVKRPTGNPRLAKAWLFAGLLLIGFTVGVLFSSSVQMGAAIGEYRQVLAER